MINLMFVIYVYQLEKDSLLWINDKKLFQSVDKAKAMWLPDMLFFHCCLFKKPIPGVLDIVVNSIIFITTQEKNALLSIQC